MQESPLTEISSQKPTGSDLWKVAALGSGLLLCGILLRSLGREYLLAFSANMAMAAICLTLAAFRRWHDWHILPLAVLFSWIVIYEGVGLVLLLNGSTDTHVYAWIADCPLFVPTVLGFSAVVYLWRIFEYQGKMESLETQLRENERRMRDRIQHAQKLESLGTLAGGIAHRYNNLLTTILGNVALARYEIEGESPLAKCLDEIEDASNRAAKISKQMLDYTGHGKFSSEDIDIGKLVEDVRSLLQSVANSGINITTEILPLCPKVRGDPSQLRQVVLSLITNAIEAMEKREGIVSVKMEPISPGNDTLASGATGKDLPLGQYVLLSIEDNGCGMEESVLESAFDPFFSTKEEEGRGLGLAAALGIVRGHHGTVCLNSTPGRGTRVDVYLPAVIT